jgi:hypothetical protein
MESFVIRFGKEAEILFLLFKFKLMYMEKCNAFLDNQWHPQIWVQNILNTIKEKKINNNSKNVQCQKRWHLNSHPHNIPFAITQNNNLPKLPSSFKHDDFGNKFSKEN